MGFEAVSHVSSETRLSLVWSFNYAGCAIIASMILTGMLTLIINADVPAGYRTWEDYVAVSGKVGSFAEIPAYISVHSKMGDFGVAVLAVAFICALFAATLGLMMVSVRTMKIMAEDNLAPRGLLVTNRAGIAQNAVKLIVFVSIPVMFLGLKVSDLVMDVSSFAITIVYGYISLGAILKYKDRIWFRISGIVGAAFSAFIFFGSVISADSFGMTLSSEDNLVLAIWSLVGLICYRYVLSLDTEFLMGRSKVLWLKMFFLLFFSTGRWSNMIIEKDLLEMESLKEVSAILTTDNLIHLVVSVLALVILLDLFSVSTSRNNELNARISHAKNKDEARISMLSNISRDLRTPMNTVLGYTNLALEDIEDKEKTEEYLHKIKSSGMELLTLLNDVIEMSKIDSGLMRLRIEKMSIPALFSDIQKALSDKGDTGKREIALNIYHLENENVYCDSARLRQVLLYLASVAIRNTPDDGKIVLGVIQLERLENGNAMYEFFVKNGTYEGDTRNTEVESLEKRPEELDIGFNVTEKIVEAMGGKIEIDKRPGKGTALYVTLELEISDNIAFRSLG